MAGEPGVEVELFGSLFVFMQQLTRQVEERLQRFGLTSRQWLLLGVLEKAFPGYAPTISEATAVFGTSRQNVKQVAGQLERGGWLRIERDAVDRRALRLVLTERLAEFHEPRVRADQTEFIHAVFTGLAPRERALFLDLVTRCTANLSLLAGPASPPERGFMNRHTSATDMSATDVGTERSPHSRSGSLTAQTVPAAGAPPAMSRRSFLRRVGVGGATVFVLADAGIAYRAYDQGVLAEGRGPAFEAWDSWRAGGDAMSLVGAAVLAASAHNTQPWRFAVSRERIDLYADLARSTGANDPLNRELDVSLGCALENLHLAARARGRQTEFALVPAGAADLVASVGLAPGSTEDGQLYRAIGDRHSNRSQYRAEPVPSSLLAAMDDLVDASVAPARLVWLTGAGDRRRFGDLLVEATRAHVADDEQSRASFAWWRSDWDEIQRSKDGLNIDGVGLGPVVRTLGKLLPATSRQAADRTFVDRTVIQARSAPAFGVLVVDDPSSRAARLAGGRLVQRLHLWSAAHDLGFQHLNQITERIDRDRQLGRTSSFEGPLADLASPGALVAFRVGTPTVPSVRSPRRPAREVLR